MPLTREQKRKIIDDLKQKIERQKIMVFVGIKGLKVKDISILRRRLREKDSQLKVAKKTLMKLAFKEKGIKFEKEELVSKEAGELAIIFGFKDEILPTKIAYQFSKENENLKIWGGYFQNRFITKEDIITLALLPSREELLAKIVGSLNAPRLNLVKILQGNLRNLVYLLSQIKVSQ